VPTEEDELADALLAALPSALRGDREEEGAEHTPRPIPAAAASPSAEIPALTPSTERMASRRARRRPCRELRIAGARGKALGDSRVVR